MNDYPPCEYTCKVCGTHELTVTRVWQILAGPESETWQEWGPLKANHLWQFKYKEKIEAVKEDVDAQMNYRKVFSKYAKDTAISKPEKHEIYEQQDNPGNDMFYVNCTGCGREIEFGWAQPDRVGGIFPAECSDFNPKEIWPESRYLNSWHEKGWLRTETD